MAVEDRRITDSDSAGVLEHDNLGSEFLCYGRGLIGRATDISTADVTLCDTANVKPYIVTRYCLGDFLVVHFDGLDFSIFVCRA